MAIKFKPCSVAGCNGNASRSARGSKGFCVRHYSRLLRYNDPTAGRIHEGAWKDFFHAVVLPYTGSECINWPFGRDDKGYGRFYFNGASKHVHRVVCEQTNGSPPNKTYEAAHSCGNGHLGCVTPSHISWKTSKENAADRIEHGTSLHGERHPNSKLADNEIREIRSLRGSLPQRVIAERFGVDQTTVSNIQVGKTWRCLP